MGVFDAAEDEKDKLKAGLAFANAYQDQEAAKAQAAAAARSDFTNSDTQNQTVTKPRLDANGNEIKGPDGKTIYDTTTIPNSGAEQTEISRQQQGIESRKTPTMTAATVGPMSQTSAANAGSAALANSAKLGPANTMSAATIGPQGYLGNQNIGSAYLNGGADGAAQNESRDVQMGLANALALQAQGKGPSIATEMLNANNERTIQQQMGMAASQKGTANASLGMRQAALGAASANQSNAYQGSLARMQEQLNAQQALGQVSSSIRGQDQSMAQLGLQSSVANQNALNDQTYKQAGLNMQSGLANQQAAFQQALFQQQAGSNNMNAMNQYGLAQGQFDQARNLFNVQANNDFALQNAGWQQQANISNQNANNAGILAQAGYNQQAGMSNQQAQLGMYGLNDAQQRALLNARIGVNEQNTQDSMAYQQFLNAINQQNANRSQMQGQIDWNKDKDLINMGAQGIGMAADVAGSSSGDAGASRTASDEKLKSRVTDGDDEIEDFNKQLAKSSFGQTDTPRFELKDDPSTNISSSYKKPPQSVAPSKSGGSPDTAIADGIKTTLTVASIAALAASDEELKKVQSGGNYDLSNFYRQLSAGGFGNGPGVLNNQTQIDITKAEGSKKSDKKEDADFKEQKAATVKGVNDLVNKEESKDSRGMDRESKVRSDLASALAKEKANTSLLPSSEDDKPKPVPFMDYLSPAKKMSDEKSKKNVEESTDIGAFLDAIKAHKYQYKDDKWGKGSFVSPMAQELEQTDLGKSMVVDTPEGKMVDYGRGFGVILASQANLNKRLEELERRKGRA